MRSVSFVAVALVVFFTGCGGSDEPTRPSKPEKPPSDESPEGMWRAQAFAGRPLVARDVDTYVALYPVVKKAGPTTAAAKDAIDGAGLTSMEWQLLQTRIDTAYRGLDGPEVMTHPKAKSDITLVRRYRSRIDAARKAE